MNKEEVINFIKDHEECDSPDFYDIFECCRERHNNIMLGVKQ